MITIHLMEFYVYGRQDMAHYDSAQKCKMRYTELKNRMESVIDYVSTLDEKLWCKGEEIEDVLLILRSG